MQAMLLAAGLGTRLRPYSDSLPKPLFPVLNRPLLDILLEMLKRAGCERIVVNGHHLSHLVRKAVSHVPGVLFQDEPEILGTGGSIRQALASFSHEPILVMNGDIFHLIDLENLYRHHINSGNIITMAVHDYPRFNSVAVDSGRIVSFVQTGETAKKNRLAFTGIHVVDPEIVRRIPAGRFHHVIDLYEELVQQGEQVGYVRVDGSYWRDIGTPEDYLQLHDELLTGGNKVSAMLPAGHGQWVVDSRALVPEGTVLSGWGCIGRAVVGRGVTLKNCVVWDNAAVQDGAFLENRIITGPAGAA